VLAELMVMDRYRGVARDAEAFRVRISAIQQQLWEALCPQQCNPAAICEGGVMMV
jgi:hypothetical protein